MNTPVVVVDGSVYALLYLKDADEFAHEPLRLIRLDAPSYEPKEMSVLKTDLPADTPCRRHDVRLALTAKKQLAVVELMNCTLQVPGTTISRLTIHLVRDGEVSQESVDFELPELATPLVSPGFLRIEDVRESIKNSMDIWVYRELGLNPDLLWRVRFSNVSRESGTAISIVPFDVDDGNGHVPRVQVTAKRGRALLRLNTVNEFVVVDEHGRDELREPLGLDLGVDGYWRGRMGVPWSRGFALTAEDPYGIVLTDDWGHATCEESGVCAAITYEDCDDNNPCTKNLCEPDVGCVNPLWEDGTYCGPDKVCQSGSCVPAG